MNILRAYTRNLFVCLCQRNARKADKANTFLFYKSDGRRYHTDFSEKIVVFRLQTKPTTITNDKYNNKHSASLHSAQFACFDKPFQAGFKLRQANDCCFDGWLVGCYFFSFVFRFKQQTIYSSLILTNFLFVSPCVSVCAYIVP